MTLFFFDKTINDKTISVTNTYNANGKIAEIKAQTLQTGGGGGSTTRTFTYDSEQRLSSIVGKYNDSQKLSVS